MGSLGREDPEPGTQPLTFAPCGVSGRLNGPEP
jgi:hypothetical protein